MLQNYRPFQIHFVLIHDVSLKEVDVDASSDLCLLVHMENKC